MAWQAKPVALALPLALGALWGTASCRNEQPQPAIVEDREALLAPPSKPPRTGPFRNPEVDPPPERSDPQQSEAQLDATLAQARTQAEAGEIHHAINSLRRCANKVPQSVQCELELGLLMARHRLYRAHAQYFLTQASRTEDPSVSDASYRDLAVVANDRALFGVAARALELLVKRGSATAADHALLATVLQHDRSRIADAIAAYDEAYRLDPSQPEWLRKQGILQAQTGDHAAALASLERYRQQVGPQSESAIALEPKIAHLRMQLARAAKAQPRTPAL